MAERSLALILIAAVGGLLPLGCECNSGQFVGIYDNLNSSDWRYTMKECGHACDACFDNWTGRAVASVSTLDSNVNGSDWRYTMTQCGYNCDAAFDHWWERAVGSLSTLYGNVSGSDWRQYVAGSCDTPACANSTNEAR